MNKSGKGAQCLFARNLGSIYPDFIGRDPENRIIADAKYKPLGNIGNKDYLQLLAYMFRFDAKTGYFLYPEAAGQQDLRLRLNRGSTYEQDVAPRADIAVIKHGLKIPPDDGTYEDFGAKMRRNEADFLAALRL